MRALLHLPIELHSYSLGNATLHKEISNCDYPVVLTANGPHSQVSTIPVKSLGTLMSVLKGKFSDSPSPMMTKGEQTFVSIFGSKVKCEKEWWV